MKNGNFQRIGSKSNSDVGKNFEMLAQKYLKKSNIDLQQKYNIKIGTGKYKKSHEFDLGNNEYLVECKTMSWTKSDNVPSAKIHAWNEAMYYFKIAPKNYKKIFFVEMFYSQKRTKTLLQYYIEKYYHLIPDDVFLYDYYVKNGNCDIYTIEECINKGIISV
jgi:hypothetical protein